MNSIDRAASSGGASRYRQRNFSKALARRRRRERRLILAGILAICFSVGTLGFLFANMVFIGHTAFLQTRIEIPVYFDPSKFEATDGDVAEAIKRANYRAIVMAGLQELLGEAKDRGASREMRRLVSSDAANHLRRTLIDDPDMIGQRTTLWVLASDKIDLITKGVVPRDVEESRRAVSDRQLSWIDRLSAQGQLKTWFNWDFFFTPDSRNPEMAGLLGAIYGSVLLMIVTLVVSFPLGVAAAVYLEWFAPKNFWTELIDVNIRNLAAVPSIVFGVLALAVFIRVFGLPRSTPLVGGLALALLTLPTIIIASRAAIAAVPRSLSEAALQLGASPMQAITRVVLPHAMPGILTGTIISLAEALGETAPLLVIGMVAFIAAMPSGFTSPAETLPVQIYIWSTSPERAFAEKTAAAIIVLLVVLVLMNGFAIYLRNRLQKRQ